MQYQWAFSNYCYLFWGEKLGFFCSGPNSFYLHGFFCVYPQPPLPVEDYPPEDYPTDDNPDSSEEHLATEIPSFSNEFSFSHVTRPNIPRANLDRSTPPGWNLTVEPNGTWVFTTENSPDQVQTIQKNTA